MKYSNLDEQMNAGFESLRDDAIPPEATDRAMRAMNAPPKIHRVSPIALKLVGVGGTAAALALAFWPRPGSGIAWAQVVNEMNHAGRVHETLALRHSNGGWTSVIDRWSDGSRYCMSYGSKGQTVFEARFDGVRSYSCQSALGFCVIQTIPPADRKSAGSFGFHGRGLNLIEDFIKDEKGKVEAQDKVTDEQLGEVLRYKIRTSMLRNRKWVFAHQLIYVEPDSRRIRKWELLDEKGEAEQRGTLDYPDSIDDSQFTIPETPPFPVHDLDVERKQVEATIRKGVGVVSAGGAKATVRAVLSENNRYLWVFWSGTPPNGDLAQPVIVAGTASKKAYGVPILTSSRVNVKEPHPSVLGPEPLSGMCIALGSATPDSLTLKIPLFVKDLKHPIRNASHQVLGYRSRFVGYDTIKNVQPIRVPSVYRFGDLTGLTAKRRSRISGPVYVGLSSGAASAKAGK